jgi:hypothetical protein
MKTSFKDLVAECLKEHLAEQTAKASKKTLKENRIKRSELKALIKEVVKQCVRESSGSKGAAGPQYKVQNGKPQLETPGLKDRVKEAPGDPELQESHKVQGTTTRTHKDAPQDPKVLRNPKKSVA